jgi:hypothetical protein
VRVEDARFGFPFEEVAVYGSSVLVTKSRGSSRVVCVEFEDDRLRRTVLVESTLLAVGPGMMIRLQLGGFPTTGVTDRSLKRSLCLPFPSAPLQSMTTTASHRLHHLGRETHVTDGHCVDPTHCLFDGIPFPRSGSRRRSPQGRGRRKR